MILFGNPLRELTDYDKNTLTRIREKISAATRDGIKTILVPKENANDIEELPDQMKKGIKIIYVSHIEEVLKIAFVEPT